MHLYATRKLDMDEIFGSFSGKIDFCCSLKKFVLEDGVRGKYYSDYHLQSVLSCLLTVIHPTLHCRRTSTLRSGNRCYIFPLALSLSLSACACWSLFCWVFFLLSALSCSYKSDIPRSSGHSQWGDIRVLSRALPGHHLHNQDQEADSLLLL